jgi:hypothetical protein
MVDNSAEHIEYVEQVAIAQNEQAKAMLAERDAEIERLRAALKQIQKPPSGNWRDLYERARDIAWEALHGR